MRLKTIVVDDEPLALELLVSYVQKTPFLELIGSFSSAIEAIHSKQLPAADLFFLDIQMPTLSGLEFSKMIESKARIIFTTAFSQYALDGYKVNALDYLLKPIGYADFLMAANKSLNWFELTSGALVVKQSIAPSVDVDDLDCIYVKSDYKLLRIELDDLLYVEGLKDYVKFYIQDQSQPILSLMSMRELEQVLPERHFIRVHRSYIVRKDKIRVIERSRIVFGDVYIPISDIYKSQFQSYLQGKKI